MSFKLEDTEISEIKSKGDKIEIITKAEIKSFDLLSIKDLEVKDLDPENRTAFLTTLGTIAGLFAGDFTGAIAGGFSGWVASKIFNKNDIQSLTLILTNDEKFSFLSNKKFNNFDQKIKKYLNNYYLKKLKENILLSENWLGNFEEKSKFQKYISFSDIFDGVNKKVHDTCESQINKSLLIDKSNQNEINSYFLKFEKINSEREKYNQNFININLNNKNLEGLILSQKKAVLTDDDSTLINAGAGSGKTKTILHKIEYLIENKMCNSEEILILAYNRNAKEELVERIKSIKNQKIKNQLVEIAENNVHTFHGFGLKQLKDKKIAKFIKKASDFESELKIKKEKEIDVIINDLYIDEQFKADLLNYFSEYFYNYKDYFVDIENFEDYVKYIRNIGQITLSGDIMRSYEEVEIANYLFINGIKFEYEKEYNGDYYYKSDDADFSIKDKNHLKRKDKKKYHPDFYLTDYKIYLEHFALDKNNNAPSFFKNPSGYYDQYLEKINVHENNNTKLITTFSWEKSEGKLLKNLEIKLKKHNVKFNKINDDELLRIFKSTGRLNRFTELVSTFMSHYKSNELNEKKIKDKLIIINGDNNKKRCLVFINLFIKVFNKYQAILKKDNLIDFDDMIIYGGNELQNQDLKYVIVDEFQDISQARAKFLRKIKELNNSKLYCVGDDWQAINQFSGGDVSIFTSDFKKLFGHYERVDIDTTFRYGNLINNISSEFIKKNPTQLKKNVSPIVDIKDSSINIYESNIFLETMEKLTQNHKNIFILGRYNLDFYDYDFKKKFYNSNIITKYDILNFTNNKTLDVSYKTIHAAKGLEADVVCLINMFPGILGFPSQMENDEILNLVLPNSDQYPNAEERRLMYVAMTRARKQVHLFSGKDFYSSDFIKELKNDFKSITQIKSYDSNGQIISEDKIDKTSRVCPTHKVKLQRRTGYRGLFYGCPKYFSPEKCQYTENA